MRLSQITFIAGKKSAEKFSTVGVGNLVLPLPLNSVIHTKHIDNKIKSQTDSTSSFS